MNIPEELKIPERWLRWRLVHRGLPKLAKVPVTTRGKSAKVNDPDTWTSFAEAAKSKVGEGMGFVLGQGIGCIDLDGAILPDGTLTDWAQALMDVVPQTFVEVSHSGVGLHIWGLLPEGPGRNLRGKDLPVEFYSQGRYIAVTGESWEDSPLELADLTPLTRALEAC